MKADFDPLDEVWESSYFSLSSEFHLKPAPPWILGESPRRVGCSGLRTTRCEEASE